MEPGLLANIEKCLWPEGFRRDVWMIADGARDRRIYGMLMDSYLESECLYGGTLPPVLEAAAPHLIQLEYEDRTTRELIQQGFGNSWGVFFKCDESMRKLRRHLKNSLLAIDERGRRMTFRYYDPRVLRMYLPTCFPNELKAFFGPIECFWIEGQERGKLTQYRFNGQVLEQTPVLTPPSRTAQAGTS